MVWKSIIQIGAAELFHIFCCFGLKRVLVSIVYKGKGAEAGLHGEKNDGEKLALFVLNLAVDNELIIVEQESSR